MNYDDVRQPDEARFETLIPNRKRGRGRRVRARNTEVPFDAPIQHMRADEDIEAALQASMMTFTQEMDIQNVLQESAEQYERECMSSADTESSECVNIDRRLATAKIQCLKLGRFDADYQTALKWINGGCMHRLKPEVLEKLLKIRLPPNEKQILEQR